ncbi:MAG: hypothetical protein RL226_31 [Bacteroidota bacterium]
MNQVLRLSTLFIALFASSFMQAQNNTIKVKIKGLKNQPVYLANYYGEKLFYNDTSMTDANGVVTFKGKPFNECGKYAVVAPGPKFFDILVTEEDIDLETDTLDLAGHLKVNKSAENVEFLGYYRFISKQRMLREPHDKVMADSSATEKQKEAARKEIDRLNNEVIAYQQDLFTRQPNMLFTKYLKMTIEPEIPAAPADVADEQTWKYYYYRQHYWDNVDLKDPRLVRDQMFHRLLDKYYTKVLPQIPDTLLKESYKLVDGMQNYDMFKYAVHYITYAAESSKIMCMDKVFVGMVEKYYRNGKVDWLKEDQMKKILDRAEELRYTVCGEPVPNIILPDTTLTNWKALYDIDAKYTIIAIWEADCGHCKKEMPKLLDLYHEWKPKGLEVYAIGNDFETEPWIKFVKEKKLDWINVSDNPAINKADSAAKLIYGGVTTLPSLNFRTTFDVFSTPKIFLLDADKRIIAKQLGAEQIEELLRNLEGEKPADKKEEKATEQEPAKEEKKASNAEKKSKKTAATAPPKGKS